jgi:fatty-acyl-CoA synthase
MKRESQASEPASASASAQTASGRDWVKRWSLAAPDKTAIIEDSCASTGSQHRTTNPTANRTATYLQLNHAATRLAVWFAELGIVKGDRVAILAENSLEHFFLFAAALKTGVIIVPLNYRLAPREIAHLLDDCAPKLLVFDDTAGSPTAQIISALDAETDAETDAEISAEINVTSNSRVPHRISLSGLSALAESPTLARTDASAGSVPPFTAVSLDDDDPLFILYTSGTTGIPKGALYTHGMLFWNALNTLLSVNLTQNDHAVVFLPLFHTGGFNVFATPFLFLGASFFLMKSFNAPAILRAVEEQRMTILMGVPTTLRLLADAPDFATRDISTLRYVVVGGEPMPIPLIETWHERGVAVRQGFGLTEVGPNIFSLHQADAMRKIGSIGQPNFYVETRIAADDEGSSNEEDSTDAPTDADGNCSGELLLRGPMTTTGYWRNPEASADALRGGWFHTGDIVRRDAEGYFFVIDRKKNMFISGGENVYPAEIERFLMQQSGLAELIAELAVVGVPDERWGEVGAVFVVAKSGVILSAEDVLGYCVGNLAKYKIPKHVRFIVELPKNDTGKINKRSLQQQFANE